MRWKLMAGMVLVALTAIVTLVTWVRSGAEQQVRSFLFGVPMEGAVEQLEDYYQQHGNWVGAEDVLPKSGTGMGHGGMSGPRQRIADGEGVVVVDTRRIQVGEALSIQELKQAVVLHDRDGTTVGYWLLESGMGLRYGDEQPLLERLNEAAWRAGVVAVAVAILASLLMASGLLYPIQQLKQAAHRLANGNYGQRVQVRGRDELAELGQSFNLMAASLQQAEENRRSMTADIAHELRTPLAVQRAQLEAMIDGIDAADVQNLQRVLEQNASLARLVEDLRTLSLAEAGKLHMEMESLALGAFVERVIERFRPSAEQKGVQLEIQCSLAGELCVWADAGRFEQILNNLLSNALRYTPKGGKIILIEDLFDTMLRLQVLDGGPGIAQDSLAHVFERFYRADGGRSREEGGAGLGLAIARQLALLQGGELTAANAPQGGAVFTLFLRQA